MDAHLYLQASHPLEIEAEKIVCRIPAGAPAWFALTEQALEMSEKIVDRIYQKTLRAWEEVAGHITYHGPYEEQVRNSLRVLRLLTHRDNGGIIAAATTSLPEVIGGERNYDYRYVWLRDAAMR